MTRKALIAGAGIGGLTAGLALAQQGWQVEVLEQAADLAPVGAGIQISPNGTKLLDRLGVLTRLNGGLYEPQAIEMRLGHSGQRIFTLPMGSAAKTRWGAGYFQIHRADLIEGLYQALMATGRASLRFGVKVTAYQNAQNGVVVGTDTDEAFGANILLGADGIHSKVRAQMIGPDQPRFTGNVAWRCLVPVDALGADAPGPTGCIWAGPGKHAVTTRVRGGAVVNFVGIVEQDDWHEEGWQLPGETARALADFAGWSPEISAILQAAESVKRWALFDRAPLGKWSDGHVVILGDAAHPMLPSMAQGGVQAIEDAWVLAKLLGTFEPAQAGTAFYNERIARVSKIQKVSAANLRLFHRKSKLAQLAAYGPMYLADKIFPQVFARRNDWIYGWTPETA